MRRLAADPAQLDARGRAVREWYELHMAQLARRSEAVFAAAAAARSMSTAGPVVPGGPLPLRTANARRPGAQTLVVPLVTGAGRSGTHALHTWLNAAGVAEVHAAQWLFQQCTQRARGGCSPIWTFGSWRGTALHSVTASCAPARLRYMRA